MGSRERWKPNLTITTEPGENGSMNTYFDFEEAPPQLPIGDLYADSGMHFQNATAYTTYYASDYYPAYSGVTVATATIPPGGNGGDGTVVVTFDFPVTKFGAYATSALPLRLACFDSNGETVDTAELPTPNLNDGKSPYKPNLPIEVVGDGIVRCTFTGSNNYYSFDDPYFSRLAAGVSCNPASPERGTETTCEANGFAVVNTWRFIPDSAGFPTVRDSVPKNEQEWKGFYGSERNGMGAGLAQGSRRVCTPA